MPTYKTLSWTAVILWMILLFALSSQVAVQSDQLSTGITESIIRTIEKIAPDVEFDISSFNHFVRKSAHLFAYLVLGILSLNAFRRSGVQGARSIALAVAVCFFYAASDEFHQLFVPGRGGQVKDVLIDSTGACVGAGVYLLIDKVVRYRKIVLNRYSS